MKKIFLSCLLFIFSFFAFAEDEFFLVSTNINELAFRLAMLEEGLVPDEVEGNSISYVGSIYLDNIAEARYIEATFDEDKILDSIILRIKPKMQDNPATVINYMVREFKLTLVDYFYHNEMPILCYSTPDNNEVNIGLRKNGILAVGYQKIKEKN